MKNQERIDSLKQELREKFGISNDRELTKKLGIKPEDKAMLYKWIEYQNAYSYREGFEHGQETPKSQVTTQETPKARVIIRFALLPIKTSDHGWIWLKHYICKQQLVDWFYLVPDFPGGGHPGTKWLTFEKYRSLFNN